MHCYWARSSSQTWSEASQSCMLQNGHLVTILSAEENAFVVSIAQFSTRSSDTWIGATDGKAGGDCTGAGTYRWVTNETWGFTSWAQGQPDGFCDPCSAGQTCTCDHRATLVSDGTWTDLWADNSRSSVCEATPDIPRFAREPGRSVHRDHRSIKFGRGGRLDTRATPARAN